MLYSVTWKLIYIYINVNRNEKIKIFQDVFFIFPIFFLISISGDFNCFEFLKALNDSIGFFIHFFFNILNRTFKFKNM